MNEIKVTYMVCHTSYNFKKYRKEVNLRAMKTVSLCGGSSCCPVVRITDEKVEIGEEGNLCVLKLDEWETLKTKILDEVI
jgi:hypothetical protein